MLGHTLRIALCHSITARAHLAGAEAAELEADASNPPAGHPDPGPFVLMLEQRAAAARRRYWRELAAVQLLVVRWHADVMKFKGSTHWRRMHDPCRDRHCYLVIKTDASNGHITPITYEELADLAVCKTRPTVIHRIVDEDGEYL